MHSEPADLPFPIRRALSGLRTQKNPKAEGRDAVRRWLCTQTRSLDPQPACDALVDRRVPRKFVRLWAQEDLFPTAQHELAARAGYPDLVREFRRLDRARKAAREQWHEDQVRLAVDSAFGDQGD